jgi:predicted Rossmann fold nucleotide-binding protein DprA/Smf involved in DNA uptake
MRVAIVGSRDWPDPFRVERYVVKLCAKHPDVVIVSGGARGVDQSAERTAANCKVLWLSFRPYEVTGQDIFGVKRVEPVNRGNKFVRSEELPLFYSSYGQAAFARNELIVSEADVVVAFQHEKSKGTQHSIDLAHELGRDCWVYES